MLENDELAVLVGASLLSVRVLYLVGRVLWGWVTDSGLPMRMSCTFTLVTGLAVAVMAVGLVSVMGGPPRGVRLLAYCGVAFGGFILGLIFDLFLDTRMFQLAVWLTSLRLARYREMLSAPGGDSRLHAATRLSTIGTYARPAFPELFEALKDDSPEVRVAVSLAILNAIGDPPPPDDTETVPAVRKSLSDPALGVRVNVATILIRFQAVSTSDALPILREGVSSKEDTVACTASYALGELGEAAEPALPELRQALFRGEPVSGVAVDALGKIGPVAIPALIEAVELGNDMVKWSAIEALAEMGEPARVALPALRKAALDPDDFVNNAAKKAIQKLGGDVG
ncbi:MAG: HEAT repeat domain-containing protein [Planctomycetia bacterium]|nr:HEAT repeat domain-containing protein [Planctomycetia bacterium]